MNGLDTLRKQYAHLDSFERAVMNAKAVETQNSDLVTALRPPTVHSAFHSTANELAFVALAFIAVHESQRGETLFWAARSAMQAIEHVKGRKGKGTPENNSKLARWLGIMEEGQRHSVAWLRALEALDAETGAACMSFARVFAGEHCAKVFQSAVKDTVEYTDELNYLRKSWNAIMQHKTNVPMAQVPADAEDDDVECDDTDD